jgi:hypothetical protein
MTQIFSSHSEHPCGCVACGLSDLAVESRAQGQPDTPCHPTVINLSDPAPEPDYYPLWFYRTFLPRLVHPGPFITGG